MDTFQKLLSEAAAARDKAILQAKRDYRIARQEILALRRRLKMNRKARPQQAKYDRQIAGGDDSCRGMTAIAAAELVLREGRAMTLTDLTVEVQRRGCRPRDDSRAIANTIRTSLARYTDRFRRDRMGKWGMV